VTTLIYAGRAPYRTTATAEGDDLWLASDELAAATGWALEPQGLCQGDRCVRIPHGREHELVRETQLTATGRQGSSQGSRQVNLAALARLLEQPVLRDDAHAVWYVSDAAPARRAATQSLQAPDFTLPDLEGHPHSLADYRGKKVFLISWASW
jgi:hypothetical protein